ncbi:hypothetical protein [Halobaculum sp. P14]|uniref:hypothetical protein n=1 Tax=Halobaculum sp. P14 TaxID=3421638 RepID=UPI003EBE9C7D
MSEDDVTLLSKEWIRENWDYENDNAPKSVQLVKMVHEWHIVIPGLLASAIVCSTFWYCGADDLTIALAFFACTGGGYRLFFPTWWCSTISGDQAG